MWGGSTARISAAGSTAPSRASAARVADAAHVARLRLLRTPRIGPVTYRQLIARFGDAAAALDALPDLARSGGGAGPAITDERTIARAIARQRVLEGKRVSVRLDIGGRRHHKRTKTNTHSINQ